MQRRFVTGDALLQALRVALRWSALDAEAIRAMIPLDGGVAYASVVQKRIDLAKLGTERYRSELQMQYDTSNTITSTIHTFLLEDNTTRVYCLSIIII